MHWKLFATLAEAAGDRTIELDRDTDETVGDALDTLLDAYPDLSAEVLNNDGEVADHINLLVDGTAVTALDGLDTPIDDDTELALFPPVSGG